MMEHTGFPVKLAGPAPPPVKPGTRLDYTVGRHYYRPVLPRCPCRIILLAGMLWLLGRAVFAVGTND